MVKDAIAVSFGPKYPGGLEAAPPAGRVAECSFTLQNLNYHWINTKETP
jgi:hypothetical protein